MKPYFAIFTPDQDNSGFTVQFPDVPGALSQGDTIEEALSMAADALSALIVTGRKGKDYQEPRSFEEIKLQAQPDDLVFPVLATEKSMEEYRPKKRVNVMVPVELLEQIGLYVKEKKELDRSKFFCHAAESYLASHQ